MLISVCVIFWTSVSLIDFSNDFNNNNKPNKLPEEI